MVFSLRREGLDWLSGGSSSQREWWGAGTSCPESLWVLYPWRYSRPAWTGPWTAWSSNRYAGWWPCLRQGCWNSMIFGVPYSSNHSMILWLVSTSRTSSVKKESSLCNNKCLPRETQFQYCLWWFLIFLILSRELTSEEDFTHLEFTNNTTHFKKLTSES